MAEKKRKMKVENTKIPSKTSSRANPDFNKRPKTKQRLDEEQKKVIKTVRKINIMAYPIKEDTKATFDSEVTKVSTILASDNYEELMKVSSDLGNMKLYFRGEEDAIDEVILFASEDSKGFVLARLLGDDMNIGDMANLAKSIEAGDIDVSQFEGVMDVFNQ